MQKSSLKYLILDLTGKNHPSHCRKKVASCVFSVSVLNSLLWVTMGLEPAALLFKYLLSSVSLDGLCAEEQKEKDNRLSSEPLKHY